MSKVMCLIWLLILNGHLYLSGISFGVAPKTNFKMACIQKRPDCFLIYDIHTRFNSPIFLRKFATACIWICESSWTSRMFHRSFGCRPTYVTQLWHQVVWYCAFTVGGESSCTSCRAFKDTSWTNWWGSSPKREFLPKGKGRELHLLFSGMVTCSGLIDQKY